MERDYSVSLTRVVATLFIVICHLGSHFNSILVGQFFNVGVPIFFLISGYLYGDKKINNVGDFLFKRYVRLEIPALLWLSITCISSFAKKKSFQNTHEVVFLLLNLQGLGFIFTRMQNLFIGPWFFTCIMFCYVLLVILRRIELKHSNIQIVTNKGGLLFLLVFCMLGLIHINISGALGFFIGLALKHYHLIDCPKKKSIFNYILFFLFAVSIRLLTKRMLDGSVFYDEIIVPLTHIILAVALFASIKWMFEITPRIMNRIASSKILQHLDRISVYAYISHDMLISGVLLSLFQLSISIYLSIPLYFVAVVILATALCFIGEFLTDVIDKTKIWLIG